MDNGFPWMSTTHFEQNELKSSENKLFSTSSTKGRVTPWSILYQLIVAKAIKRAIWWASLINSTHFQPFSSNPCARYSPFCIKPSKQSLPLTVAIKIFYKFLVSSMHATCLIHFILFGLIIIIIISGLCAQMTCLPIMLFHPTPCQFTPIRTKYSPQLRRTIEQTSGVLSWNIFLNVIDQVSHPSRTTCISIVWHIWILMLFGNLKF